MINNMASQLAQNQGGEVQEMTGDTWFTWNATTSRLGESSVWLFTIFPTTPGFWEYSTLLKLSDTDVDSFTLLVC